MSVRARILRALRLNTHSPSELADLLQITLKELHAEITVMNQNGFDIAQHPLLGLELHAEPQPLAPEQIEAYMPEWWLHRIETHSAIHSTNTLALERGMKGDPGPAAFFAESQTAGRGRFGRAWESAAGEGLWMSLLLRPTLPMRIWPRITTVAALAVAETIELLAPVKTQIKWPNDVVCEGKKIAGILAETGHHPSAGAFIVLGIGLNVNQRSFSGALSETATSLQILTNIPQNRAQIAANLLSRIHALLGEMESGFSRILNLVTERSQVIGRSLSVNIGGSVVAGIAEALDEDGCLILRLQNGETRVLNAGEVTLHNCLQTAVGSPLPIPQQSEPPNPS